MDNEVLNNQPFSTDNLGQDESSGTLVVVLRFLRRFMVLLIVTTLLGLGLGFGYAKTRDQTVYTQTKAVMFIAKIDNKAMATNIALTNKYIKSIPDMIVTPIFISKANEVYRLKGGSGYIYGGSINIKEDGGMVLSVSYSDGDPVAAEKKLDVFIEAVQLMFESGDYLTADEIKIEAIDNIPSLSSSNGFARLIFAGVLGGFVAGILIALLFYLLDNTVSNRPELERLTGATVVAYIDDINQ